MVDFKSKLKKNPKEQVAENVTITTRKSGKDTVKKAGKPLDQTVKHPPQDLTKEEPVRMIGVSFGFTVNLENYESMRVDCWATDFVHPEHDTYEIRFAELAKIVRKQVSEEINKFLEEANS